VRPTAQRPSATPGAAGLGPGRKDSKWSWPFGPTRRWSIAGRTTYCFDGTNPGPVGFTLLGSNPPEDASHPGQSFRMAALSVRGQTVVIVLQTPPGEPLAAFLPIATRLLSTLRFPPA
jgi:hypothetical protein